MPIPPIARLKKSELIWLANHRCKHGHSYISHFNCYLEEMPEGSPLLKKIGFFDIESYNLKANLGVLFGYCIKEHNTNKIYESWVNKEDFDHSHKTGNMPDKRVIQQCIEDLRKFDIIITYYGCLTKGHKILKKDLTWVNVENLVKGDELLSFEDNPSGKFRKYQTSKVLHNEMIQKECSMIHLSDGTVLKASNDHKWLVQRANYWQWKRTDELLHFNGKNTMQRILPVWQNDNNYHAGYLAAFFDGEGCLSQPLKTDRDYENYNFAIVFSQKDDTIVNKLEKSLNYFNFKYSIRNYDKNHPDMKAITILGGLQEKLRFLGITQPSKNSRIDYDKLLHNRILKFDEVTIDKIESIGIQEVCGLGTTSETYISDGFCSHNTRFDFPYVRTKALMNNIEFPEYGELVHMDLYYLIRNKFSMHRKSLDVACETLLGVSDKTRVEPKLWLRALYGDMKAIGYIRDHCVIDVKLTEKLYNKIIPFRKRVDQSA